MSDCKIYPADTVDIYGNAWPTVGENIRNGIFGENVKVGYVNIDNGKITSNDFIIKDNGDNSSFRIDNIIIFSAFVKTIKRGGLNISIVNVPQFAVVRNGGSLSDTRATIKIIYKEVV